MAILTKVPGVKVEVMVDGEPLQEYDDGSEPVVMHETTKYVQVQSQTGKEFSIKVTFTHPFRERNMSFIVALDGNSRINSGHISADELRNYAGHELGSIITKAGIDRYEQKFCFEKLQTSMPSSA